MYFRVNLKMKKATCCFTWIVFIELNFTVAFLLIEETCDDRFAVKVWGWGILKNGVILVMRGMILNWGTFLQTMKGSCGFKNGSLSV